MQKTDPIYSDDELSCIGDYSYRGWSHEEHMAVWRDEKTLPQCMMHMLENEIMCDVTLRVGKHQIPIKAHKYMLSSRSPVFHTMFEGSLPEKGKVSIPDIDEKTFRDLLRFIYSDKMEITNENVKEMLYAAEKYMLSTIKKQCEWVLKTSTRTIHAVKVLETAYQFQLLNLQEESFDYIEKNTIYCLSSDYALSLPKECVEMILKSDYLECSETDICTFFLKWVNKQCESTNIDTTGKNMRTKAGHLLYLVRFPVVQMDYFSKKVVGSGLLTFEEVAEIYQSHFGVESETFLNRARCPVEKRPTVTVYRSDRITSYWTSSGGDAVTFIVDRDIWLKGVVICCPYYSDQANRQYGYNQQASFNVTLNVTDEENKQIASTTQQFRSNCAYESTQNVYFLGTTRISHGNKYTLRMEANTTYNCYYCTNAKPVVSANGVTITFDNSPLSSSRTNKDQGQFAGILFSV